MRSTTASVFSSEIIAHIDSSWNVRSLGGTHGGVYPLQKLFVVPLWNFSNFKFVNKFAIGIPWLYVFIIYFRLIDGTKKGRSKPEGRRVSIGS